MPACKFYNIKDPEKYCTNNSSSPIVGRCTGQGGTDADCDKHVPVKEVPLDKDVDFGKVYQKMFTDGLSWCCDKPIDESHVIQEGRHKNHGPRYCSHCGQMAYRV